MHANKVRTREIFLVARQSDVLQKIISLPKTTMENLQQVLEYELENHFPFALEQMYFDHTILNQRQPLKTDIDVLVSVITRDRFDKYREMIDMTDLNMLSMEPPLTARGSLFQWLQGNGLVPSSLMVLDRHSRGMDMDLCLPAYWQHQSILTYPSLYDGVKKWMFQCENTSNKQVQKEKGTEETPFLCMNDIQVEESFLTEMEEYFPRLELTEILSETGLTKAESGSMYAFGAALGALWRRRLHLNFIPATERKKQRRIALYLFIVLLSIVVLLGSAVLTKPLIQAMVQYKELRTRISELSKQVKAVEKKRNLLNELKKRVEPLSKKDRLDVLMVLKELTNIIPQDSWLTQFSLEDRRIRIRGESENANALIPLLETSMYFQEATFSSPVVKRRGKDIFYIEMKIQGEKS